MQEQGRKCRLSEINVRRIDRYRASKLKEGFTAKTVNDHTGKLGKALQAAVDWGYLASKPIIKKLKVTPPGFKHLTPAESQKLLSAINDPLWYSMVLVGLRTGMRFGELAGLLWNDVDLQRGFLAVRHSMVNGIMGPPKNGRVRYIPLNASVIDCLSGQKTQEGHVFRMPDGTPVKKSTADRNLKRLCRLAGIDKISWHVLRHSFASQLVSAGIPIRTVQDYLGHASITMTQRYSHLSPATLQDSIKILDGLTASSRHSPQGHSVDGLKKDAYASNRTHLPDPA